MLVRSVRSVRKVAPTAILFLLGIGAQVSDFHNNTVAALFFVAAALWAFYAYAWAPPALIEGG